MEYIEGGRVSASYRYDFRLVVSLHQRRENVWMRLGKSWWILGYLRLPVGGAHTTPTTDLRYGYLPTSGITHSPVSTY